MRVTRWSCSTTLANGGAAGADPRAVFAERLSELGHLTASFSDDDPPQVRLALPDLTLQCVPQPDPGGDPAHLALRVISLKPVSDHPEGAKILTLTARHPVVTAANGVASDTFRILDWRRAAAKAAKSERLYATLKLVERLESAEKGRAQTQRTRYVAAREFWRCKTCRALWRPGRAHPLPLLRPRVRRRRPRASRRSPRSSSPYPRARPSTSPPTRRCWWSPRTSPTSSAGCRGSTTAATPSR